MSLNQVPDHAGLSRFHHKLVNGRMGQAVAGAGTSRAPFVLRVRASDPTMPDASQEPSPETTNTNTIAEPATFPARPLIR